MPAGRNVALRGARRLICAASVVAAAAGPISLHGQAASADCQVIPRSLPPAARDSVLRSLNPDEIALTGFVRDAQTGAPVRLATVLVEGTTWGMMTAEDGGYLIRFVEGGGPMPSRPMVKACEVGWEYLTEVREVFLKTPWEGTVVVGPDGVPFRNPGYAVRLDFELRQRPSVF